MLFKFYRYIVLFALCLMNAGPATAADILITREKAFRKMYRQADRFEKEVMIFSDNDKKTIASQAGIVWDQTHADRITIHTAYVESEMLGWICEDTVQGKWGPIHYAVAINPDGLIHKAIVLDYQEIRGKPVAKRRFLKQYRHKGVKDSIKIRKDIDGVSGATISSRSLTSGIRKCVHAIDMTK